MRDVKSVRQIRVLHVGPGWGQRGGIASVLDELQSLRGVFDSMNLDLRFCETHGFRNVRGVLRFAMLDIPAFVSSLARGVDIVHFHVSIKGSFVRKFLLFAVARLMRKRVVFHLHAGNFAAFIGGSQFLGARAVRVFLRGSAAVVGVSRALGEELIALGAPRARVYVIGNSVIDAERVFSTAHRRRDEHVEEPPRILFAGRLVETKGIGDLLEAVALLTREGVGVKVTIAGAGDTSRWTRNVVRLGIADRVAFPGWLEGGAKLATYRNASLFCMPSHHESFGIATLEAMFAGLPVVGTRLGGFLDLVEDQRTGYLVSPSAPTELADALRRLISDAALAKEMGRRGRERAYQCFSTAAVVERYVHMYGRVMGVNA